MNAVETGPALGPRQPLVADLSLEGPSDSRRMTLTGQVDAAKGELQVGGVPVVVQGHAGLIGIAKTGRPLPLSSR